MSSTGVDDARGGTDSSLALNWFRRVGRWFDAEVHREAATRSGFALWPIGIGFGIAAAMTNRLALPELVTWSLGVGAVVLWTTVRRNVWAASFVAFIAAAAIGQGVSQIEIRHTDTTILSGDVTTRLTGRVLQRESDERGRQRYVLHVIATERPHLSRPPERVRVLVSARHEPLPIAGTFTGLVRLRPPAGPAYPDAYDFAFAPFFDGLGAYGFALGRPTSGPANDATLSDRIARLRLAMGERIRAVLPNAAGAVASALITGERAGVPDQIENDLRATSLAHILSISGFHMALVAGFVMLTLRSLLALFPSIALRFSTRKAAAAGALAATGFYFLLSGDNAATERSFIMIALMLGAVLLDRPALTLRNVALAATVVMLLSPHAVLTATFQMSFAATAALVGGFGAYTRWRTSRERDGGPHDRSTLRFVFFALAATTLSSLIAGAATAPYGIFHFQRVAPFGLIANLVTTPLFTFWVMPLALISAVAMPFGWEMPALKLMGWGLELSFAIAHQLAAWLPDQAIGRLSIASLVLFTLAILALSFFAGRLRWLCLPLTAGALIVSAPPKAPELLVFEDGREVALQIADGSWSYLQRKPDRFVVEQWQRAFAFAGPTNSADAFRCIDDVCRARTPTSLRVAWTDKWEKLDDVCRDADIAIVARATRQTRCANGTTLATLRTLRLTGTLGVSRSNGAMTVRPSVDPLRQPWNAHRLAAWPERWRRDRVSPSATVPTVSDSDGSTRPGDPAP